MSYSKMHYAGYKHLAYRPKTHEHLLLNLQTHTVEIWVPTHEEVGIPYKNTYLGFKELVE